MRTIADFIALGSVEGISENLTAGQTDITSREGQHAAIACQVLATRSVEKTLKRLDDAATRLQWLAIAIAIASLAAAIVSIFQS